MQTFSAVYANVWNADFSDIGFWHLADAAYVRTCGMTFDEVQRVS